MSYLSPSTVRGLGRLFAILIGLQLVAAKDLHLNQHIFPVCSSWSFVYLDNLSWRLALFFSPNIISLLSVSNVKKAFLISCNMCDSVSVFSNIQALDFG